MMTAVEPGVSHPPPFTISAERASIGTTRVCVFGELDLATAKTFRNLLLGVIRPSQANVVVDASQLLFCDSQGAAALIVAAELAEAYEGRITVENARPAVAGVLRITGADRRLSVHTAATPPA